MLVLEKGLKGSAEIRIFLFFHMTLSKNKVNNLGITKVRQLKILH